VTITYALYTVTTGEGTEKQEESEPRREYVSALASYDIPVGIIYRTVSAVLHANYAKRIAGMLFDVSESVVSFLCFLVCFLVLFSIGQCHFAFTLFPSSHFSS
jgi:hypothetical protein